MSFWDGEKITRLTPMIYPHYPGWLIIDCGCSDGLEWGGDYPVECKRCDGNGWIAFHRCSKITAKYPGGPFC